MDFFEAMVNLVKPLSLCVVDMNVHFLEFLRIQERNDRLLNVMMNCANDVRDRLDQSVISMHDDFDSALMDVDNDIGV